MNYELWNWIWSFFKIKQVNMQCDTRMHAISALWKSLKEIIFIGQV